MDLTDSVQSEIETISEVTQPITETSETTSLVERTDMVVPVPVVETTESEQGQGLTSLLILEKIDEKLTKGQTIDVDSSEIADLLSQDYYTTNHKDSNFDKLSEKEQTAVINQVLTKYQNYFVQTVLPDAKKVTSQNEMPFGSEYHSGQKFIDVIKDIAQKNPDLAPFERVKLAQVQMVKEYNANLTSDLTVDSLTKLGNTQQILTILKQAFRGQDVVATWQQNKVALLKALYLLETQYNFGKTNDTVTSAIDYIMTIASPDQSVLTKLKNIGSYTASDKTAFANLLFDNEKLYTSQIKPITNLATPLDFVKVLAKTSKQSLDDYLRTVTEAVIQKSELSQVEPDNVAKTLQNLGLLLPVLAQGKGAVVGGTRDTVVLGITDVYAVSSHQAGTSQLAISSMINSLNQMENYNSFLRAASTHVGNKTAQTPTDLVARDSLMTGGFENNVDKRHWETKESNIAVRHLFAPMKLDSATTIQKVISMVKNRVKQSLLPIILNFLMVSGPVPHFIHMK